MRIFTFEKVSILEARGQGRSRTEKIFTPGGFYHIYCPKKIEKLMSIDVHKFRGANSKSHSTHSVRGDEEGILAEDRVPVAVPIQGGPHPVLATALPISLTKSAA